MTLPAIGQSYIDAYNRKDVAALVNGVADAVVFENISNAGQSMKIAGREAFAQLADQARQCSRPGLSVRTAVVNGDYVALEADWRATPAVDLGLMKAGKEVVMRGASFITIADEKLVRIVDLS
jgi:ketosteroid isomerase-like protein